MRMLYSCLFFFAFFLLTAPTTFAQCDSVDLAQGRPASASSVQDGNTAAFDPSFAFDGDSVNSRWSSDAGIDPQYIYVDLGIAYNLCQVRIYWETAYASSYRIDATNDTTLGWTTLKTITANTTKINTIDVAGLGSGPYRFVRMYGTVRATGFGYSMYAMQVFGFPPPCNPTNIAQNQPIFASSQESGAFTPSGANDGDLNTRWASAFNDAESITVNLGGSYPLCRSTLYWFGNTYPSSFAIDISDDNITYTTDTTITGNISAYNIISLTGSAQYVRMRGITRNNIGVGYSLEEFQVTASGTLPVKLASFTANTENNQRVRLSWTTDIEANNQYFSVERSIDGTHYSAIGKVPGAGNSASPINYQWTDSFPAKGRNYYRLRQVDLDGRSEYSGVITASISVTGSQLSLYPNPARETVNIVNPTGVMIREIHLFNTSGVEVKRFSPLTGNTTIPLSIGDLSQGIYTLKVLTDRGTEVLKVLK